MKQTIVELRINQNDRFDPVQLIPNICENPKSERIDSVSQMKLNEFGRLDESEELKILKSLILTRFGFSK